MEFCCSVGKARGHWRASGTPQPGSYDIEIDIANDVRQWEQVEAAVDEIRSEGSAEDAQIVIIGTIERVDADSVAYLRVGSDLVMVEMRGTLGLVEGSRVKVTVPSIDLYPYQL
ncbi:hypothetical protein ABT104_20635 [Streptomyces mobaraensis]|uniref:hypothetical protein n=1 Tax=Streptomyces mobaraensis TaxID=35621 RepID=UPI003317FC9C